METLNELIKITNWHYEVKWSKIRDLISSITKNSHDYVENIYENQI